MNDKPNSFSEYFEAAKAHPAYWEEAIELAVSEGTVKSLAKQIAKIHSNKLSKIELYTELREIIDTTGNKIYKEKQQIPWSGTNLGATFAVTTSCVSYNLEKMQHEIGDLLRDVKI